MAELVPIPLDLQLHRAFVEYERQGSLFHLPRENFFRGSSGLDLSVISNGHRASTPLGPAAGPHTQLLQNIVLCWLAGSRIIELKTVQVLDELRIPRPCIDSANVTFNVEWSQELKLEQSLREYASAAMFLQILKASELLGDNYPRGCDNTIFDMSIGYNLEGIQSPRVRSWIEGMKDATRVIGELRSTLSGRFRRYRDLSFEPRISDTITLSTFHGCPPEEIEGIVAFLLRDMGLHVCIKLNPTLLGKEKVTHLLLDVLGYRDIELNDDSFRNDLTFAQATEMLPHLQSVARAHGKRLSVKLSNTLVVRNNRKVFRDELMYMSGPALHVITLNLVQQFRDSMGTRFPISFSAGLTAQNMADMVALNLVPVTTCTDLLRPGGYGRLPRYLDSLATSMNSCGATTISEFVILSQGRGAEAVECVANRFEELLGAAIANCPAEQAARRWVSQELIPALHAWIAERDRPLHRVCREVTDKFRTDPAIHSDVRLGELQLAVESIESMLTEYAGVLNTTTIVQSHTDDVRYRWGNNTTSPRRTPSTLELFDCMACNKCVTVCPNVANFEYETSNSPVVYYDYELYAGGGFSAVAERVFELKRTRQFANHADVCNDCGNCEVACPDIGAPNAAKPRFFGTPHSFECDTGDNKFVVEADGLSLNMCAVIDGRRYTLSVDKASDRARFTTEDAEFVLNHSRNQLLRWHSKADNPITPRRLDLTPYLQMKVLLAGVTDMRRINYVNSTILLGAHT